MANQQIPVQMDDQDLDWLNPANIDALTLDVETMAAFMSIPAPQLSGDSSMIPDTYQSPPPPYSEAAPSETTIPSQGLPQSTVTSLPPRTSASSIPSAGPNPTGAGGSKKWASEEDWDRHRPTITRLYVKENKKLWQLLEYMEREHQFRAT